jgi:hypothetical protein
MLESHGKDTLYHLIQCACMAHHYLVKRVCRALASKRQNSTTLVVCYMC